MRSPIRSSPSRDLLEPRDHAQRRRLAAAGRADEHHQLAVLDREIEVEDRLRAVVVDLLDVDELDLRHRRRLAYSSVSARRPIRGAGTRTARSGRSSRSASSRARGSTSATPGWSRGRATSSRRAPGGSRSSSRTRRTARRARSSTSAGTAARSSPKAPATGRRCSARTTRGRTVSTGGCARRRGRTSSSTTSGLAPVRLERWGPFLFVNADADAEPLADSLGAGSGAGRGARPRRRRAAVPSPRRVERRGELEGRRGELPRVLPLRRRAPGLHGARRRVAGRVPARGRPAGTRRRSARRATARRAASSTSSGRTPGSTSSPASRTCRSGRSSRRAPEPHRPLPRLLLRRRTSTSRGSPSCSSSTTQVGREDTALVERVQIGVASGALADGRLLGEAERLVAHFQGLVRDALDELAAAEEPAARPLRRRLLAERARAGGDVVGGERR